MTPTASSTLDVLLLESHPHVGDRAAGELESAGHRVHRCHADPSEHVCAALTDDGRCPIDGGIDVAVLVRRPLEPTPTHLEDGVTCARRAGIPVVEQGPEHPDPWAPHVEVRLDPDSTELAHVTGVVARGADAAAEAAIRRTLAPLLRSAGVDPSAVICRIERAGTSVAVHVTLPKPADRRLRSAIGVRVLDGLRAAATRTLGNVDVYVHPSLEGSDG
jgi:hypothetical protein